MALVFAISHQTGAPFARTVFAICSPSVHGTRGSLKPATMKSGLVILAAEAMGEIRSKNSFICGSRSSPYSTRRRSLR